MKKLTFLSLFLLVLVVALAVLLARSYDHANALNLQLDKLVADSNAQHDADTGVVEDARAEGYYHAMYDICNVAGMDVSEDACMADVIKIMNADWMHQNSPGWHWPLDDPSKRHE